MDFALIAKLHSEELEGRTDVLLKDASILTMLDALNAEIPINLLRLGCALLKTVSKLPMDAA